MAFPEFDFSAQHLGSHHRIQSDHKPNQGVKGRLSLFLQKISSQILLFTGCQGEILDLTS